MGFQPIVNGTKRRDIRMAAPARWARKWCLAMTGEVLFAAVLADGRLERLEEEPELRGGRDACGCSGRGLWMRLGRRGGC